MQRRQRRRRENIREGQEDVVITLCVWCGKTERKVLDFLCMDEKLDHVKKWSCGQNLLNMVNNGKTLNVSEQGNHMTMFTGNSHHTSSSG